MGSKVSKKIKPVVVPRTLLRKIGHRPGQPVQFKLEGERILVTVTPRRKSKRKFKARIIKDPITGFPVLDKITRPKVPTLARPPADINDVTVSAYSSKIGLPCEARLPRRNAK